MGTRDVAEQLEAAIDHISELEGKLRRIAELSNPGRVLTIVELIERDGEIHSLTAEYLRG